MNTEITDNNAGKTAGWIFYDAACSLCVQGRLRVGRLFESRGFGWLPLQTPGAAVQLGVTDTAFAIRMHLLMPDGRVLHNADALGVLCRSVWWLWPLGVLLLVPGFRELGRLTYDWFARNRYCIGGACRVNVKTRTRTGLLDWLPLVVLPATAIICRSLMPDWVFMWALAFAIFFGCKWLTLRRAFAERPRPHRLTALAYLFLWPGMDADTFFTGRATHRPAFLAWASATAKTIVGLALLWLATARIVPLQTLLAGWLGMFGVVLFLHFGLFHLLALFWQTTGRDVTPVMRAPLLATSLADFWGNRWNTAFNKLAHDLAFRPLVRRIGVAWATAGVFLISGVIHDLVISLPARGGYGLPTAYFLLQGVSVLFERSRTGRTLGLGRGSRGWLFVFVVTTAPAFWLFHLPFIHNVILPMLHAFGATWNAP